MAISMEENRAEAHTLLTHRHPPVPKTKQENAMIRTLRSCCIIPQRYVLGVMGLLGICNAYTMRVCLNMAITQMVNRTQLDTEHFDPDACPSDEIANVNATSSSAYRPYAIFEWSESTQGLILSSFYYGYAVAQIPGSYFANTCGEKWTLGMGLLTTALLTFLTPMVTRIGGAASLFALRVLQGFGEVGHDWGYYTMVSDLPKYATDVLKYNIATTGVLTALPYVAMWMTSFVFSFMCDFSLRRGWHSIKTGRIIYTSIGKLGPAICIILASYSGCDRTAAMAYFVGSMALMSAYYSGMKVNTLDVAPNHVGALTSLCITFSTFAGIITPYLIGLLTPDSTLHQWRVAFWICFAVLVVTNVAYCAWAEGEQQWWDDVARYGYPEGWRHGPIVKDSDDRKDTKL